MSVALAEDEFVCVRCDPSDNVWPASAFGAAGNAFKRGKVCNACYGEAYHKRRTCCKRCGKDMVTRGKGRAMCRTCKRGDEDGDE